MLSNRFYKDSEGTVHEVNVAEAVDKAKPMRPVEKRRLNSSIYYVCGRCHDSVQHLRDTRMAFCCSCGQAQDWSEVK